MPQLSEIPERTLWTITETANVTNQRTAFLVINPNLSLNRYFPRVWFALFVSAINNLQLDDVRIYGSNSAASPEGRPPPGSLTETLVRFGAGPILIGTYMRAPGMLQAGGGQMLPAPLVPHILDLEWDTSGAGAGPSITFAVNVYGVGWVPESSQ